VCRCSLSYSWRKSFPEKALTFLTARLLPARFTAWTPVHQPSIIASSRSARCSFWPGCASTIAGPGYCYALIAVFAALSWPAAGPGGDLAGYGGRSVIAVIEASYMMAYRDA